jgi:hypothetical protein
MSEECWTCKTAVKIPTCAIPKMLGNKDVEPSDKQLEDWRTTHELGCTLDLGPEDALTLRK